MRQFDQARFDDGARPPWQLVPLGHLTQMGVIAAWAADKGREGAHQLQSRSINANIKWARSLHSWRTSG